MGANHIIKSALPEWERNPHMTTTKKLKNFIATRTRIITTKEVATTERLAKDAKAVQDLLGNDYDYSNQRVIYDGGTRTVLSMTETLDIKEAA